MLVASAQALGASRIGVVTYGPDDDWGLGSAVPAVELVPVPTWPFDRDRWSVPSVDAAFRAFDLVLIAGNDCIDGGYSDEGTIALLELARLVDECGCRVSFVNCSYNARPTAGVVRALQELPARIAFWFRDALSAASFAASTGRPPHLGAEIAFLTGARPAADCSPVAWVARQKDAGKTVVALVPNPMVGTDEPLRAPNRDPAPYVEVIERVARSAPGAFRFVVIPNDARPAVGDLELASAVAAAVPAELRDDVYLVPAPLPAAILVELFRHLDLVVGARFHALVMALIAGTPIVALEYQDKMLGVLRVSGLEEFWIRCQGGLAPATIAARVADALERSEEVRAAIRVAVPGLRRRATDMIRSVLTGGG